MKPLFHRKTPPLPFLLAVSVLFVLPGAPLGAPGERETAMVAALRGGPVEQRREALDWLAKNGRQKSAEAVVSSLRDSDGGVRKLAENALWSIWSRSGDPIADEMLKLGTYLMGNGNLRKSVEIFSQIIADQPGFAEGYNKRATAWYLLGAYDRSLEDIRLTLERNRFHFGALSGAGYCLLKKERPAAAVAYLERALKINPNLESVRALILEVRKEIPGQAL